MAQDRTSRRIVILGGGFAGVETAIALEKGMSRHERETTEIVLVSENNYLVFQPLLPEVISGTLETLHCIAPIRRLTRWTKLYTRRIERIDLKARQVQLAPGYLPKPLTLNYDHLVIALGTQLNFDLVPGSREHALPFKYLEDALRLRNRIVQALEEADNEPDPAEKQRLLTFLVAGGGFSGVECLAELNDFVQAAVHAYRNIRPEEIRCVLVQSGERILPELDAGLASYAQAILERRGIEIHLNTRMKAVSADAVVIQAKTGGEPQQIPTRTVV
ncbi:MAG: FAD-dependent oxidoreductase, partial [Planctomycetaceae bacterium]|nr:FAD-dependent oxidoreductase [Planctomycetaceae bacterium]